MKMSLSFVFSLCLVVAASAQKQNHPEVEEYLNKVARGEAGVDPRDQTAARSGDPYAQARIQQRLANNRITEQENKGSITPEQAAFQRQQAEIARQQQARNIELERIRREIERQNLELQRLRMQRELDAAKAAKAAERARFPVFR